MALLLDADARNIAERTEHATFAIARKHLGPTRGAIMANLSRTFRDVTLFCAAAERERQVGCCD